MIYFNKNEVALSYSYKKSSTLDRITLSSSWKLESWGWVEGAKDWQLGVFFPKDLCDTYNICSAYGSCIINMIDQSCACMDETRFVPRNKKRWEMVDWSDGCVRRTPLDCEIGTEKFIKYSNVKLPDIHDSWFNKSMNMQECEAQCLDNCTCMAYAEANTSLGGRGCLLWFGELINIRVYPEGKGGRDIFVRLASSELGNGSYLPILQ
ncbi:putative non-specific serine/threonine protein kinase [Helianthus anomalus]